VKSLKHKHQVKAEQLRAMLSTTDLILVFQSSHLTAGALTQLRKEASLAFSGQSVAPIYLTGRSAVYKKLIPEDKYQAFLRLFSGPSCLLCLNWDNDFNDFNDLLSLKPLKSDLDSARCGLLALRRWFTACGLEGSSSAGVTALGSLTVMGGIFEGRLLSAEEVRAMFVSKSSEWAEVWRFMDNDSNNSTVVRQLDVSKEDFLTGGQSLLPVLQTLSASYLFAGAECLHCLGSLSEEDI
jgi:hypothetical protein